jgi:multimeric flavodoxin WrbA
VAGALEAQGIETEIFQVGTKSISGCLGCAACIKTGKCVIDDVVNDFVEKAKEADGFVFGSPVHFASASGAITSFMDRAFYGKGAVFANKPAAAIMSCRRGGATATLDQLIKYFTISNMPVVSSQYWNMVHGNTPDEVRQDLEGMQTMRTLGVNMAWLLKCIEAGKAAGIELPQREAKVATNFIR